jgi:hypothetical protein
MNKTIELESFESLTVDQDAGSNKVKVIFLNKKLLEMADNYKNNNNQAGLSSVQNSSAIDSSEEFQLTR